MSTALAVIGIILSILSIYLFYKSKKIKIKKAKLQQEYLVQLQQQINKLYEKKKNITNNLLKYQSEQLKRIDENLQKQKISKNKKMEQLFLQQLNSDLKAHKAKKQQQIQKIDKELEEYKRNKQQQIEEVKKAKEQIETDVKIQLDKLETLKETINAGIQAQLREREKDKDFYSLTISDIDLADVEKLEKLKRELHNPVILSKLIWTQYFQKQMSSLCDRVLGKTKICGIYKITDLINQKCYIGRSLDVAERWKQHCKCGLGIEATATNTLYNTMQKHGVWNFTFELLEKCSKEELDQKESFWIDTYQSNIYGLNTLKGNKS